MSLQNKISFFSFFRPPNESKTKQKYLLNYEFNEFTNLFGMFLCTKRCDCMPYAFRFIIAWHIEYKIPLMWSRTIIVRISREHQGRRVIGE